MSEPNKHDWKDGRCKNCGIRWNDRNEECPKSTSKGGNNDRSMLHLQGDRGVEVS